MEHHITIWSPSWSGYHGRDNDIPGDGYNSTSSVMVSRHSISPLHSHQYSPREPHRSYPEHPLSIQGNDLLHPQPDSISHATFVTGNDSWRRSSFPTYSDGSARSSTISSTWSDRHLSPELNSSSALLDDVSYAYGGLSPPSRHDSHASVSCVAMYEVQTLADNLADTPTVSFPDESQTWPHGAYGTHMVEDGYQPMEQDANHHMPVTDLSTPSSSDYRSQGTSRHESQEPDREQVRIRRRRPTTTSPPTSTTKISKRPQHKRHSASCRSITSVDEPSDDKPSSAKKAFPCSFAIYGCRASFGMKNEWKRHVHTQHLRLNYWRCEQCAAADANRKPNDFNRRDLFIQHVRRMHPFDGAGTSRATEGKAPENMGEEQYLESEASRCCRQLRKAPQSSRCLFCDQHFRGDDSWDQRMEHVGRHLEDAKRINDTNLQHPQQWNIDRDLEQYLCAERILVENTRGLLVLSDILCHR